jgi:hypothetical protein
MEFAFSKKAIAVHTIVLVIMMGFFAIVGFFFFYKWSDEVEIQASETSCTFKKIAFCTDWKLNNYGDTPFNWDEKKPVGCEEFGIEEPTIDECQKM